MKSEEVYCIRFADDWNEISKPGINDKTKRPVSTGHFCLEKSRTDRFEKRNAIVWVDIRFVTGGG